MAGLFWSLGQGHQRHHGKDQSNMDDTYAREPCPWRIIDDCGGAFSMGLIGGGIIYSFNGLYSAPKSRRFRHAFNNMASKAPKTGGSFAMWGFTFSLCDCTLMHIRKKEDPWNAIMSGGATGAILAARNGVPAMAAAAVIGAALLGMIEGVGLLINRKMAEGMRPVSPMEMQQNMDPADLGPVNRGGMPV